MREATVRVRQEPTYSQNRFSEYQAELDYLLAKGAGVSTLKSYLTKLFYENENAIRATSGQNLNPLTVETEILKPRQDLYLFILYNCVRHLLMPAIRTQLGNLLIFGLGRIFSAYNDTGVQHSTDADLNLIFQDGIKASDVQKMEKELVRFQRIVLDEFTIHVEVNPAFTVLSVNTVLDRLTSKDAEARKMAEMFYKCNVDSLFVLHDNPDLRDAVFSKVRRLPDSYLFVNFLGDNGSKPTLVKLRSDRAALTIVADGTGEKETVDCVIGSRSFLSRCRKLRRVHPELYPSSWVFSIKYLVNRVYDYVSAMLYKGYSLKDIGFLGRDDPDFLFLRKAHKFMLYLQELIHLKLDTFNVNCDSSFMSSERFNEFATIHGEQFRQHFESMAGNLLYRSQKNTFAYLKQKIVESRRDRLIDGVTKDVQFVLKSYNLAYEKIDQDASRLKVCVPYTWADLGFFVFNAIAERILLIVDAKIIPTLVGLGMSSKEIDSNREALAG